MQSQEYTNTPDSENYPAWSHTTNTLAYTAHRNGVWNLYLYDLDSGNSRAISNVLTGIFQLSWSNDDQNLIFSGYSDIGWDIYSLTNPLDMETVDVQASKLCLKKVQNRKRKMLNLLSNVKKRKKQRNR